jgi:hypothetical protein
MKIGTSHNQYLSAAIEWLPNLSDRGFGFWDTFEADRKQLAQRGAEFDAVRAWIWRHLNAIRTMNRRHSSYGLKHIAERELGHYISNGLFIAAMAGAGFRVQPVGHNAHFNVSEKSVRVAAKRSTAHFQRACGNNCVVSSR